VNTAALIEAHAKWGTSPVRYRIADGIKRALLALLIDRLGVPLILVKKLFNRGKD